MSTLPDYSAKCNLFTFCITPCCRNFSKRMNKKAHKRTLVVWLGNQRAKYYHLVLIIVSAILGPLYVIFNYHSAYQFLFILAFPLFFRNAIAVFRYNDPMELYPELKRLALATLVFAVTFGIGMII